MPRVPNSIRVRTALLKAGRTQTEIARELAVSPQAVGQVIAGTRHNLRIRAAIAAACETTVERLFPPTRKPSVRRSKPPRRTVDVA